MMEVPCGVEAAAGLETPIPDTDSWQAFPLETLPI